MSLEGKTIAILPAPRGTEDPEFAKPRDAVREAGGRWVDQAVSVDRGLITSRTPDDLHAFYARLIEEFAEGRHDAQTAST